MLFQGWRQYLDLVFPRSCSLCRRPIVGSRSPTLCGHCQQRIKPIAQSCWKCGAPKLSGEQQPEFDRDSSKPKSSKRSCRFCQKQDWDINRVFAYTVYSGSAAHAARLCKDSMHESLARSLSDSIGDWLDQRDDFLPICYDYIIPIPQHWFRRLMFRYHPASVFAMGLAGRFGIPMSESYLKRSRWTTKQGLKTISERRESIRDAFAVSHPKKIEYRSVLLVDDVMTSGGTLADAARALKAAGARQVDAVVFARGISAGKLQASAPPSENRMQKAHVLHSYQSSATAEELRRRLH